MYLAALGRLVTLASTYFAEPLEVVGGGGSHRNKLMFRSKNVRSKIVLRKKATKK